MPNGETVPAIICRGLITSYEPSLNRSILQDVNISIASGEFVGLLGLNGAGKSSLLRSLVGLMPIHQGEVILNGVGLEPMTLQQVRRETALLFQGGGLVGQLSAINNVLCGCLGQRSPLKTLWGFDKRDRQRALELLDKLGLADQALQRTDLLSGGQQQRVAIARAMMQSPRILLVDEPTTGLDVVATRQVMNYLKRLQAQGMTILAILHDLKLVADYCDRVIILQTGQVCYDGICDNLSSHFT